MDNNTLAIYIHELRNQCMHTEAAFNLFNQALNSQAGSGVLFASQMVMKPAAQLSAILWPPRARSRHRAEHLRKVLQLSEKHPLNDRRLAELWERADEKLDEWIADTKGQRILVDYVGDMKEIEGEPTPDKNIFRAYNPVTRIFYYRGVGYNLQGIADAVTDLSGRINAVYRQLFPEQVKAEEEARRQIAAAQKAAADAAAKAADPKPEAVQGEEGKKAPAKKTSAKKEPAPKAAAPKKPAAKKAAAKK